MKKQGLKLISVFITILFLAMGACSDKDDTDPNGNTQDAPALQTKTVTLPETMTQSNDPGAQMASIYVNMANAFAGFAGLMAPPPGGYYKTTTDGDPWVYTWNYNEDGDVYTVTLTIFETSTHYEWTMIINGTVGGIVLTDFLYMEASQTKDGSSGGYQMYNPEIGGLAMTTSWATDQAGVYNLTFEVPVDIKIEMTSYPDGSGEIKVYEWFENAYELSFEAIWDAAGHGEWWEYYEGELSDHGIW